MVAAAARERTPRDGVWLYSWEAWQRIRMREDERARIKAKVDRMSPTEYLAFVAEEKRREEERVAAVERRCAEARVYLAQFPAPSRVRPLDEVVVHVGRAQVFTRPLRKGQREILGRALHEHVELLREDAKRGPIVVERMLVTSLEVWADHKTAFDRVRIGMT